MKLIESAGTIAFQKDVVYILLDMSKKNQKINYLCQITPYHVALTVLGQTVNTMVDAGCSNTILSTAAVAQMHLQQLMDRTYVHMCEQCRECK